MPKNGFKCLKCLQCGKERLVAKQQIAKPTFTGLCHQCHLRSPQFREIIEKNHAVKRNRPLSERPFWKRPDGYLEITLPPNHWCYPMINKSRKSILVHRLVMAEHLGRLLETTELVHHKDGVKNNNRIENLSITTLGTHERSYEAGYILGYKDGMAIRDKTLEKQIRLLRWQIKELIQSRQLNLGSGFRIWE